MISYSFTAFLAVSYAAFFSRPIIFVGIYLGLVLGGVATEILKDATDAAFAGDLISALLVALVGIYLHWTSKDLKAGRIPNEGSKRTGRQLR